MTQISGVDQIEKFFAVNFVSLQLTRYKKQPSINVIQNSATIAQYRLVKDIDNCTKN